MVSIISRLKRLSKKQLQKICIILNKKYKKNNTKKEIILLLLKPLNIHKFNFIELLGESVYDNSFQKRHPNLRDIEYGIYDPEKEGYINNCPRLDRLYKWSEIKSSFLMKQIIHSQYYGKSIYNSLTKYLQKLNIRLFTELSRTLNRQGVSGEQFLEHELDEYMVQLPYARQKDKLRSYPVAQSPAWINDKQGLYNNFYPLWNFTKYVWYNLKNGVYRSDKYALNSGCNFYATTYWMVIDIFQQNFLYFQDILRGERIDEKGNGNYKEFYQKNDQIGITNIIIPYLKRQVVTKPDYDVEAWHHPGEVQCRVPYRGEYGKQIQKYRDQKGLFNNFYGSLQCGISGSTQYILFMYLLSYMEIPIDNPENDVRDVITSACLVLTGDGGHNIREVLSGLTCSIIVLYNLLRDIIFDLRNFIINLTGNYPNFKDNWKQEMKFIKNNLEDINTYQIKFLIENYKIMNILYNYCDVKLQSVCNQNETITVFRNLLLCLTNWYPFINEFYNYTRDFNITGIDSTNMELMIKETFNRQQIKNKIETRNLMKYASYEYLFSPYGVESFLDDIQNKNKTLLQLQLLLGSDNDRYQYTQDTSFKKAPDIIIRNIIKKYQSIGEKTLKDVNVLLDNIRNICLEKYEDRFSLGFQTLLNTKAKNIPFA